MQSFWALALGWLLLEKGNSFSLIAIRLQGFDGHENKGKLILSGHVPPVHLFVDLFNKYQQPVLSGAASGTWGEWRTWHVPALEEVQFQHIICVWLVSIGGEGLELLEGTPLKEGDLLCEIRVGREVRSRQTEEQ